MSKPAASPSSSSLIAQLGAAGGALSGWQALLWVLRLMISVGLTEGRDTAGAALWAMLRRVACGDFALRGCSVTRWTVNRGLERTDYTRFQVTGDGDIVGGSDGFTLTVEWVHNERAEAWPIGADVCAPWSVRSVAVTMGNLRKLGLAAT